MHRCLLAALVCGCAATASGPAVVIEREIIRVPPDLADCPGIPARIPEPAQPHSLDAIAKWMKAKIPRDQKVEFAAVECRKTVKALVSLIEHSPRVEK